MYGLLNIKGTVNVFETPSFIGVQYDNKPLVLISKTNGRLYCIEGEYPLKYQQHQASFVLRILKKFGLVENVHYRRIKMGEKKEIERGIES